MGDRSKIAFRDVAACWSSALALLLCLIAIPAIGHAHWLSLFRFADDAAQLGARGTRAIDDLSAAARHARVALPEKPRGVAVLTKDGDELKIITHADDGKPFTQPTSATVLAEQLSKAEISVLLIPEEWLAAVHNEILRLPPAIRLHITRRDSSLLPIEVADGRIMARMNKDGVFVHVASAADLDRYAAIAQTPISRSQFELVSLFDKKEVDIVHMLDKRAGDIHKAVRPEEVPALIGSATQDRVRIIIGHVEERSFVMRGVNGEALARLDIDALTSTAKKSGQNLLLLGCETGCVAPSGFLSPVNVSAVADALALLRTGGTHGELLSALARASPEGLVVTSSLLDDIGLLVTARVRSEKLAANRQLAFNSIRVVASVPGAGPVASTIGFVAGAWLVGLFFSVFQLRSAWRNWRDSGSWEGDSYGAAIKVRAIRIWRFGVFIILFPYLVLAEVAYLLSLFFLLIGTAGLGLLIGLLITYPMVLAGWIYLVRNKFPKNDTVDYERTLPLLTGWRDYIAVYSLTASPPIWLATLLIDSLLRSMGASLSLSWVLGMMVAPIPLYYLAKGCCHAGIGPYELPIAKLSYLIAWVRLPKDVRNQTTRQVAWRNFAGAWREG